MPKWFESWFDSEFYHLLYNNRDEAEAARFIQNLCVFLKLPKGSAIADIACGKGRHSRVLASLGFRIIGLDISPASIEYACSMAGPNEQYIVHDMRKTFPVEGLDAAMNLFTSFGYFDDDEEDRICLSNVHRALKPTGMFVQDYLNPVYTLQNLKAEESVDRGQVSFSIQRYVEDGFIRKDIQVSHGQELQKFQESVKIYPLDKLKQLHEQAGFRVLHVLGDYSLNAFDEKTSPRIILVSQKS